MAELKGTNTETETYSHEYFAYKEVKRVRIQHVEARELSLPGFPEVSEPEFWVVQANLTGAEADWFDAYISSSEEDAFAWLNSEIREIF